MSLIREVWSYNLQEELDVLKSNLQQFPIVSINAKFPGFLTKTSKGASEQEFYDSMRLNVNQTKVIQLGLTVSDESRTEAMSWQFNFRDFDEDEDAQNPTYIAYLKKRGFDFKKLRRKGIASEEFTAGFFPICRSGLISKWITIHGLYHIGYLLKLLKIRSLPNSMEAFVAIAQHLLGNVSDIKHMARLFDDGEIRLKKMVKLFVVDPIGIACEAGSYSLFTATLYAKMKRKLKKISSEDEHEGFLCGLSYRIETKRAEMKIVDPLELKSSSSSDKSCGSFTFSSTPRSFSHVAASPVFGTVYYIH